MSAQLLNAALPPPPIRRRRAVVIALVALAITAVIVISVLVVDRIVAAQTESVIAEEVGEAVGAPVDARIHGGLAGLRVLTGGGVARLTLEAELVPVPEAGVVIDQLSVVVRDLELDAARAPTAGEGSFVATFDETQVRLAVPAAVGGQLQLGDTALLLDISLAAIPLQLVVSDNTLRVELPVDIPILDQAVGSATEVPLTVPDGVEVTGVEVRDGLLRLTGTIDPVVVAGQF